MNQAVQKPKFCPIHKRTTENIICSTCNKLTCYTCLKKEHSDHVTLSMDEALDEFK